MLFVLLIIITNYFDEMLQLFTYLVFVQKTYHVLKTHKESKLIGVALKPNVINFFREIFTMSVEMPFGKDCF
jgi:hypothetical protein